MFAIFESLGRQYKVSVGDRIRLDRISEEGAEAAPGTKVIFHQVLMLGEPEQTKIGKPFIDGAKIEAEIVGEGKEKKLVAFKKKRRKGYHRKVGHRRQYSEVIIREIKAA